MKNVLYLPVKSFMQICLAGNVFLGSIDMTGSMKDVDYVSTHVKRYIIGMDPKNI